MRALLYLLHLPNALLLLIPTHHAAAISLNVPWPYNPPSHSKYSPEDEQLVRQSNGIQGKLVEQRPVAVKKMPADEGEMFFLEYWRFGEGEIALQDGKVRTMDKRLIGDPWKSTEDCEGLENPFNASIPLIQKFQPPLLVHAEQSSNQNLFGRSYLPRAAALLPRDFICPSGTFSCTSINEPNSCCGNGLTCEIVPDSALGTVGCCTEGATCSDVASCQDGYTSCPSSQGGGCCIPGFECSGVGCKPHLQTFPVYVRC